MRIVLSCGRDGLMEYHGCWRALECPLKHPSHLALEGGRLAVLDSQERAIWTDGKTIPVDSGVEAFCLRRGYALTLSGETDCITKMDLASGQPVVTAPCGVYPQNFCLMPYGMLAVCGGGDGTVRLMSADDLIARRTLRLPGMTERIAWSGDWLHVLCAVGDTVIHCRYVRVHPTGQIQPVTLLPGLPGAVCADGAGGAWVASSETLCHYPFACLAPDHVLGGSGLIRHLRCADGLLLVSDPVKGVFSALDAQWNTVARLHGDVGQAIMM